MLTPFSITFIWLNTVLAKEVWKGRDNFSCNVPTITRGVSSFIVARRVKRKQRQIRIFKVIVALMAVFLLCRVPNWVFSVFMLFSTRQERVHWLLYFSFGLLALINCMLNPFIYTFLSETIRVTNLLAGIFCGIFCFMKNLCKCKFPPSTLQRE